MSTVPPAARPPGPRPSSSLHTAISAPGDDHRLVTVTVTVTVTVPALPLMLPGPQLSGLTFSPSGHLRGPHTLPCPAELTPYTWRTRPPPGGGSPWLRAPLVGRFLRLPTAMRPPPAAQAGPWSCSKHRGTARWPARRPPGHTMAPPAPWAAPEPVPGCHPNPLPSPIPVLPAPREHPHSTPYSPHLSTPPRNTTSLHGPMLAHLRNKTQKQIKRQFRFKQERGQPQEYQASVPGFRLPGATSPSGFGGIKVPASAWLSPAVILRFISFVFPPRCLLCPSPFYRAFGNKTQNPLWDLGPRSRSV